MKRYELVVVKKTGLDKASDKLLALFKKIKAKVIEKQELGVRELAYPIKRETRGVYIKYRIETAEDLGRQLSRFFHLNSKNYLRYLLVVRED